MNLEDINLVTLPMTASFLCYFVNLLRVISKFKWLFFRDVEKIALLETGRAEEFKKSCFLVTERKESLKNRATAPSISLSLACVRTQLYETTSGRDR